MMWRLYRRGRLNSIKRYANPTTTKVAHSQRMRELHEYQMAMRRYRRWLIALAGGVILAICGAVALTARPSVISIVTPAQKNRDIMLCLDVSGSMMSVDKKVVETYISLLDSFKGQRVGFDMFNNVGLQVVPVTDDYDLLREKLQLTKKMLEYSENADRSDSKSESDYYAFFSGTRYNSDNVASSNVGLGLAGCIKHLGANDTQRSQSIILATDNEIYGSAEEKVITTTQAMMMAKQRGVRVYALDPGVYDERARKSDPNEADNYKGEHMILKTGAELTSGVYYRLKSENIIPDVVERISAQETKMYMGDSQRAVTDSPLVPYMLLVIGICCIVFVSWRLKL